MGDFGVSIVRAACPRLRSPHQGAPQAAPQSRPRAHRLGKSCHDWRRFRLLLHTR